MTISRRHLLSQAAAFGTVSVADWLGFFRRQGVPGTPGDWAIANARAADPATPDAPTFLIYWFLEGGWDAYSMLAPVDTRNDSAISVPAGTLTPTPSWSDQVYRVKGFGTAPTGLSRVIGATRAGFLAQPGADLFPDMAVVSSHYGNTFHSGGRFDYHYGRYNRDLGAQRLADERTVLQAFCEAKGASYLLPHVSWHRWLADGELAFANYPEGTGYYEKLGPPHAHTVYGRTPEDFRARLLALGDVASQQRRGAIRAYTDSLHDNFLRGRDGQTVRAFSSALEIWRSLSRGALPMDPNTLFKDPALRTHFGVTAADERSTEQSVNGNPARSKNSPHVKVQALMAYELMRLGLSCAFWIESRDVRAFDSHRSRRSVLDGDSNSNQLALVNDDLWNPLRAFVAKLKATPCPGLETRSLWDQATIVVASEMGRTIMGDVRPILAANGTVDEKYTQILEQDVCQHWALSSVAFLGGQVKGGTQFGSVGATTLDAIPTLPDGSLDPAYDVTTGLLRAGATKASSSFVSDAGHVYSTALALAGVDPAGKGRNTRPALGFVKKS